MRDLDRFVREDLGVRGDVTTRAVLGAARRPVRARVLARERLVAAGLVEAREVFERFRVRARLRAREGRWVPPGATLLEVRGPAAGVLAAERLALNIAGRMSGIASETRRIQDAVARVNPMCRVAATRKTTPGFRLYEKRAVALGGGDPHRYGLYDAILIKDNHLALVGDARRAVERARRTRPRLPVEIEVSTRRDAVSAARAGADWLLIDNLPPPEARRVAAAARRARPGVRIECSGGITPRRVAAYAAFADRVSMGRITHSARGADVSLEILAGRTAKP